MGSLESSRPASFLSESAARADRPKTIRGFSTFLSLPGNDMYASIVKDRVVNQAQCPRELGGRDPSGPLFPDPLSL